jgi:hypothetical protein
MIGVLRRRKVTGVYKKLTVNPANMGGREMIGTSFLMAGVTATHQKLARRC